MHVNTRFRQWIAIFTVLLSACGGGDGDVNTDNVGGDGNNGFGPLATLDITMPGIKTLLLSWPDATGETGYRVFEQLEGSLAAVEVASLPANTTQHALSVFLPERLNARYSIQACNAAGCVAYSSVTTVTTAALNQATGYFKTTANAFLGDSVVLSADGSTLAMGVPNDKSVAGDPNDVSAPASGAVLVFTKGPAGWVLQQFIKAAVPTVNARFGSSLAISADGIRMVIASGLPRKVHVFERVGSHWAQEEVLPDPQPLLLLDFGSPLALAGDGNTLAVRASGSAGQFNVVYVYTRSPLGWQDPPAALVSDQDHDRYGDALALSTSGDTLLVGAPFSTADAPPDAPGVVHVFTRMAGVWSHQTRLTASNAGIGDGFGTSVALSGDGLTAAVGAKFEDSPALDIDGDQGNGRLNSGAAYVFVFNAGAWTQQAYIKAFNASEFDEFGHALSLSADGNTLAVGSPDEDGSRQGLGVDQDDTSIRAGAVYLFRRDGTAWRATRYIKAPNAEDGDAFGTNLALSGDGQTLAVLAEGEDSTATGIGGDQSDNTTSGSGAVYLY